MMITKCMSFECTGAKLVGHIMLERGVMITKCMSFECTGAKLVGQIMLERGVMITKCMSCLLYTSPSPRDSGISRMPSSA